LHQIVQDFDPVHGAGNGFVFHDYHAEALWDCVLRVKRTFQDAGTWKAIMQRAMSADFSWARSVERYEEVYATLLGGAA
jgi:starch synthase